MAKDVFGTEDSIGEVQIASEVVSAIAGISASEVDGIESMVGNGINDIAGKLGVKNHSKGVKVDITDDKAELDIAVNMRFGYSIPKVSAKVQEKVSQAINSMTGLEVTKVNVRIAGIASPDKE
ncbi:MAG: Asp23/Gls24 family envelope stress response protein [Roseburia sp.]|nr:Asp23/Gls24 family envelope stress response protein [Roseburia sp.]